MRRISLSYVAAAAVLLAAGCNGRLASKSASDSEAQAAGVESDAEAQPELEPDDPGFAPSSESERTRAMEEKQAEMERKMEEARSGNLSPQELEQAYQELEQDRQELNQMSEGAPPAADADAASDYPPPPR